MVRERLHFDGYFERTFGRQSEPCGPLLRQRRIQVAVWFVTNGFDVPEALTKNSLPNRRSGISISEIIGIHAPSKSINFAPAALSRAGY